jgi:hypothetical protein
MKTLFTLLLCLCAALAHAQVADTVKLPIDPTTKRITYASVVQVPGASQAELYTRAKLWFAGAFNSAKDVVQADEKDAGIIQGKGWSTIEVHPMGTKRPGVDQRLWYTVRLICREGRYRYEITNLLVEHIPSVTYPNPGPPTPSEEVLEQWAHPSDKYAATAARFAAVVTEYKHQIRDSATGLATSIKTGMAHTPGGKDW